MKKIYTLLLSAVLLMTAGCGNLLGNLGLGQGTGSESGAKVKRITPLHGQR